MNLICPHCQKQVGVEPSLAGQTTNCPYCGGPFTVPYPPAGLGEGAPEVFSVREGSNTAVPPQSSPKPDEALASEPAAPPPVPLPGEYRFRIAFPLSARVLKWLGPACFLLILVSLFFPWVGIYVGDETLVRQTGIGAIFGVLTKRSDQFVPSLPDAGMAVFLVFYFLAILTGVLALMGLAFLEYAPPDLRKNLSPFLRQLIPWRSYVIGGISLLSLLFLSFYFLWPLPLESAARMDGERVYAEVAQGAAHLRVDPAALLTQEPLERRFGYDAAVFLTLLAVASSLGDIWLERRQKRPPPRLLLEW